MRPGIAIMRRPQSSEGATGCRAQSEPSLSACSPSSRVGAHLSCRGAVHVIVLVALGGLVLLPLLLGMALYVSFRPSSEVRVLRRCVERTLATRLDAQVQFGVRPFVFAVARLGCSLADAPPEVCLALRALHSGGVGVYRVPETADFAPATLIAKSNTVMAERGWDRLVGVVDGGNSVAVFVPKQTPAANSLSLCVLVCDGAQLITVTARGDPEPLVDLALDRAAEHLRAVRMR